MPNRKQPLAVLEAKGAKHLTASEKAERTASEVRAPVPDRITVPKWVPKEAKAEFSKLGKQLAELGIYSELDRDTLGRYVIAHRQYLDATEHLNDAIASGVGKDADEWGRVQDRHFKQCRACAADLGLTISARCKLVVPEKPQTVQDK